MSKWLRVIRGAVMKGLTRSVVWAPVGVLTGMIVGPDGAMDEMWVAVGATWQLAAHRLRTVCL